MSNFKLLIVLNFFYFIKIFSEKKLIEIKSIVKNKVNLFLAFHLINKKFIIYIKFSKIYK